MQQIVNTNHVLEIAGPRGQIWRPAADEVLRPAKQLAVRGELVAAIEAAQDAYIEKNGSMLGVAFRVRTTTETLSGLCAVDSILNEPKD